MATKSGSSRLHVCDITWGECSLLAVLISLRFCLADPGKKFLKELSEPWCMYSAPWLWLIQAPEVKFGPEKLGWGQIWGYGWDNTATCDQFSGSLRQANMKLQYKNLNNVSIFSPISNTRFPYYKTCHKVIWLLCQTVASNIPHFKILSAFFCSLGCFSDWIRPNQRPAASTLHSTACLSHKTHSKDLISHKRSTMTATALIMLCFYFHLQYMILSEMLAFRLYKLDREIKWICRDI